MPDIILDSIAAPSADAVVSATQETPQVETAVTEGSPTAAVGEDVSTSASTPDIPVETPDEPVGMKNLRGSYQKRVQEIADLKEQLAAKEDAVSKALLSVQQPAEDWDVSTDLDRIRDSYGPYYNKLGWEIIMRHLPDALPVLLEDPAGLRPDVQNLLDQSAVSILTAYSGLTPEQVVAAIQTYRSSVQPGYRGTPTATPTVSQDSFYQHNLDPQDPAHRALISRDAQREQEMAALRAELDGLKSTISRGTVEAATRSVDETLDAARSTYLSEYKVPPEYDYLLEDIKYIAERNFQSDPIVQTALKNAKGFYAQGTKELAASDMAKLQNRLAFHIKNAAGPRMNQIAELERYKTQTSQVQAQVRNFAPQVGGAPSTIPLQPNERVTSETAAEIAVRNFRERQGRQG